MKAKRVLFSAMALLLAVAMMPLAAFAAVDFDTAVSNGYYNVISKDVYALAPGATETEIVLNNSDGTRRQIVHVFEVDPKNENIEVLPGYYGIDKLDPDNLSDSTHWKAEQLTKTVAYYEDVLGYNVVGAMNTALAYDSNAPYDFMVYNGVVLADPANHSGNAQTYLAIDKEGNAELRSATEPLTGEEWTVIAANFGWLVKDGELTSKTVERTTAPASRSMIGIKADGSLIFCQVDGRSAPTSVGLSNYEMGEMMLSLGCVYAVNGDGGGSSTFVSKREGTSEHVMRSIPSDGSERPTINSVILVSTAKATGEFDHAVLDADYDYYAPCSSATIKVTGVDAAGSPAEVPEEGISWALSDNSFGTVANGVFASNGKLGDVTVQMLYNGNVVGEKVIHVVNPDVFAFNVSDTVLPYGKGMDIIFAATYGSDDWAVCVDGAYTLSLSNDSAATVEGKKLIATSDESISGVVLTATYNENTSVTATMNITFGKGSEILFDFEDGELSGFVGFDEAKKWSEENGVNNSLVGSNPLGGQYSDEADGYTSVSSAANGSPVRNGNYALAWHIDNRNANFAQWTYNVLFNIEETIVLRDVANGKNATKLGMWLYIPEGATGMAFQAQLFTKTETGGLTHYQAHYTFTTASGAVKNLNSCTEADIPESRWVYASIDLTAKDYLCMPVATDESSERSPSFIRTYIKPMLPAVHTFYIDDITLDYSSAVDDRVLPTISDVNYATADTSVTLENGVVINANTIAFSATIADNIALDYSTGKIYVDGVALNNVTCSGKVLASGDVVLSAGAHTVIFEIKDALGNTAKVIRDFTIVGDAAVSLGGHNNTNAPAEYDSIYYVDVNVADIANVEKLVAVLKLQTANSWETEGIIVADGYKATCVYNEANGLLTVTVEKVGGAMVAAVSDSTAIVSVPVRVWSWTAINHVTGAVIAPATQFATGNCPIVTINCEVECGVVEYANGSESTFGGNITVATNLNDIANPWHVHDTELTVLNADATCTKDGYTGRTYCETCGSVIDWGTVVPATDHSYVVYDDHLVCDKGDYAIEGTGLVTVNDNIYYLINSKLATGWQSLATDEWMYFDANTKAATIGTATIGGLTYTFNENGVVVKGAWVTNSTGTRYSYGPGFYTRVWKEIEGATYYFGTDSYMYTGERRIAVNRNNINEGYKWYNFSEDGKLIETYTQTGFIKVDGVIYFLRDGISLYEGLIEYEGGYYYINSKFVVVTGTYTITKNNDLKPIGTYEFDENGKMVIYVKNGIVYENGAYWYYKDGELCHAGLMYDEEGGFYFYVRTSGKLATGSYPVHATYANGLLPADTYDFGTDGKLYIEEENPEVKNGVYYENGAYWYYKDGELYHAGLMYDEEGGYYYYVRTSGQLATGNHTVYASYANGLLPAGTYNFGPEGKLYLDNEEEEEPVGKNGIYYENGAYWYYKNDQLYHAGLIYDETEGCYYYVRTSGKLATGTYPVHATYANGLLPAGTYEFGADGKLFVEGEKPEEKNGIVYENGAYWYYKDGELYHAGLIYDEAEGCYYYVRTSGKLATGKYTVYASYANGLLPAGVYEFGADGKLFID